MLAYLDTFIGFAVVMLGASLLITILTQMVSALLSHRGANLKWGLTTLFQHVPNCPAINKLEVAEKLAKDVLSHPLISDSVFSVKLPIPIPPWLADRFRLATAIHPDELVAILKDLSTQPVYQAIPNLATEIDALIAARNPAAERRLSLLTGTPPLTALPLDKTVPLLQDTLSELRDEGGKLEAWFNSAMDRVSSRFTTYATLWTVGFAIAFALITGLNSVVLLSALYTNGDFRQQLTGAATQMTDLASKVVPAKGSYTAVVAQALQDSKATPDTPPNEFDSESDAIAWITAHVKDPAQQSAALAALGNAFLNQRSKDAAAVHDILTKASFDITQFRWDHQKPLLPQIPGVLVTAAFLSLGAPFWFNMLKQLSNLRPILANKQDAPTS